MASSWRIGFCCHGAGGRNVIFALALVMAVNLFTVAGLKDLNDDLQEVVDFHSHLVTEYGQAESKWKLVNVLHDAVLQWLASGGSPTLGRSVGLSEHIQVQLLIELSEFTLGTHGQQLARR
jgi:hypothetical protein